MNFTATGADVDGDTLTYAWTFGDGGTASVQNPSHTYASAGSYTSYVTVSDGKGGSASASVVVTVTPAVAGWSDSLEAYAVGSQLRLQGGWKGWDNKVAAGALVAGTPVRGGAKSMAITGASDLVHEYSGATTGQWIYTAWQYVPTNYVGKQYFLMLNTYVDGGAKNWSVEVYLDWVSGKVHSNPENAEFALVKGRWVELRVEINLDLDVQSFYYDGQKLYTKSWTAGRSGGGVRNIAAVDLYAGNASAVYYDDMSLVPGTSREPQGKRLSVSP